MSQKLTKEHNDTLMQLTADVQRLAASCDQMKATICRASVRKYQKLQRQLTESRFRLAQAQKARRINGFVERMNALVKLEEKHSGKDAILTTILETNTEQNGIADHTKCSTCHVPLSYNARCNMLVCMTCGTSCPFLDTRTQEFMVSKNYRRSPLYSKYLFQFSDQFQPPDSDTMALIRSEIDKLHFNIPEKLRTTTLIQVLRKCKLSAWVSSSVRLVQILQKKDSPRLPADLVDRLLDRFKEVSKFFSDNNARKKILSFEYLTNRFMKMEGHHELAKHWKLHKTRDVLLRADRNLRACCDALGWEFTPSC